MKFAVMLTASPWGSTRAATALRLLRAALQEGHEIALVYFRSDGVYNALAAEGGDAPGAPDARNWADFAQASGCRLLVCSADSSRRMVFDQAVADGPFELAGLATWWRESMQCDRAVVF